MTLFLVTDALFPLGLPDAETDFAVTVTADDGSPLRAFPDRKGVWRYPITRDQVSPRYLDCLLTYEDRYFFRHPGVNPLALTRALWQGLRAGRIISGGSTLTMQVARMLHPHPRSVAGKCMQIFRALQLEFHLTKTEILEFYLNYAPFGGPVEGVQAAAFTYLGKSARRLSRAEAALLAVLPQAPSRLRPDRHPGRAEKARNKVLRRMVRLGSWRAEEAESAMLESVPNRFAPRPMTAPLLSRRLRGHARPDSPVHTFIDTRIQELCRRIIQEETSRMPAGVSGAVLVMENGTGKIRAYVGSAGFLDQDRFGHVDMIPAIRSPGSTLKPFLYGMALEEGLIHSESLLTDTPLAFGPYRPANFTRHFTGPVSAAEALRRSLNLPAVDLLHRIGPRFFDARLRQGGLSPVYPNEAPPDLPLILGGVGISLEDLVSGFAALADEGLSPRPRFQEEDPVLKRRLLSPGAAWIVRRILSEARRPDLPRGRLVPRRSRRLAWKTGTSYGMRDAWTIGVSDDWTAGVWIGRPDGTPSPGRYGLVTAAPVFFRLMDALPPGLRKKQRMGGPGSRGMPPSVSRREICWPLGIPPESPEAPFCHVRRKAWVLDGVIPPTFPDRTPDGKSTARNPVSVPVDAATGYLATHECPAADYRIRRIARWPLALRPWLRPRLAALSRLPEPPPGCGGGRRTAGVRIDGPPDGTLLRPPPGQEPVVRIPLSAAGGRNHLYWLLNGDLVAETAPGQAACTEIRRSGRYRLTVMDSSGGFDAVEFRVVLR